MQAVGQVLDAGSHTEQLLSSQGPPLSLVPLLSRSVLGVCMRLEEGVSATPGLGGKGKQEVRSWTWNMRLSRPGVALNRLPLLTRCDDRD